MGRKTPLKHSQVQAKRQFNHALRRLEHQISRFRALDFSEHGQKWIDSQVAYWERRRAELLASMPAWMRDEAPHE